MFLKLTEQNTSRSIVINFDNVDSFFAIGGGTRIIHTSVVRDDNSYSEVSESVDTILGVLTRNNEDIKYEQN